MKVSVCMIVRNEEPRLARALESTEGLADEVVILDTGSTDGTVALAKQLGARVFVGGDRYHKAESRNRAMAEATGDWIVILDADEVIADPAGVRSTIEGTEADALYIQVAYRSGGKDTLTFRQMRAWKKGVVQYRYRAHEVPITAPGAKIVTTSHRWEHHQPKGDSSWKRGYTLVRLLLDVDENPDATRPLYYLGREYAYIEAWRMAIKALHQFATLAMPEDPDLPEALGYMAQAYEGLGDLENARRCLERAAELQPKRREWIGRLALLDYGAKDFGSAANRLVSAWGFERPLSGYVVENWYSGPYLPDITSRALYYAGRKEEGRLYAKLAHELSPEDERLRTNLTFFD